MHNEYDRETKTCRTCGATFHRRSKYSTKQWEAAEFCSRACQVPWNKGLTKADDLRLAKITAGWQCQRCGGTERYAKECAACARARTKLRHKENPERQAVYTAKWRASNRELQRERGRERMREWRADNPEKEKTRRQRHNARHKLKRNAAGREWYARNRERVAELAKKWYIANYHRMLASNNRRRSLGKTAAPRWLIESGQKDEIDQLYTMAKAQGLHVDHNIPLAGCMVCGARGLHVLANLQMLERSTNIAKKNRCMDCWLSVRQHGDAAWRGHQRAVEA